LQRFLASILSHAIKNISHVLTKAAAKINMLRFAAGCAATLTVGEAVFTGFFNLYRQTALASFPAFWQNTNR